MKLAALLAILSVASAAPAETIQVSGSSNGVKYVSDNTVNGVAVKDGYSGTIKTNTKLNIESFGNVEIVGSANGEAILNAQTGTLRGAAAGTGKDDDCLVNGSANGIIEYNLNGSIKAFGAADASGKCRGISGSGGINGNGYADTKGNTAISGTYCYILNGKQVCSESKGSSGSAGSSSSSSSASGTTAGSKSSAGPISGFSAKTGSDSATSSANILGSSFITVSVAVAIGMLI